MLSLDGVVIGQGAVTFLITAVMLLLGIVHVLRGLGAQRWRIRHGASMIGIYVVMIAAVILFIRANNGLAQDRAERVVAALERYRAQHGDYPADLGALVPEQLPSVPRAKYTLTFGTFSYHYDPARKTGYLGYTTLPPFGRQMYSLADHGWGSLD